MFRIRMLPADYGDCLWVEYGSGKKTYRLLIDAGTLAAYKEVRARIEADLPEKSRFFDLFLISHIDTDHIDTAVKLLNSPSLGLKFGDLWFNGWKQLVDADTLGPQQGEYVSALVEEHHINLNKAWKGKTIVVPDGGKLPRCTLPGRMKVTLLSPGQEQLRKLRGYWKTLMMDSAGDAKAALKKLAAAKKYKDVLGKGKMPDVKSLADRPFEPDNATPNGSSIVVLLEYDGRRCLFAADSHPDVLESGIDRLLAEEGSTRLKLDALKVPHHGSRHNNSVTLYKKLNCRCYLVSTNGNRFQHPHAEAIARIIQYGGRGVRLFFNYDSEFTRVWDNHELKRRYGYSVTMRTKSEPSLDIEL